LLQDPRACATESWGRNLIRRHNTPQTFTLQDDRNRYALHHSDADLQAAHAHCPWLVTWDDHEVANDYAGETSAQNDHPELFLARRAAAYRVYYEHMPLPRAAVPFGASMRLYTQHAFGDLARVYMLDGRRYRDVQACSPLGERSGAVANCEALHDVRRTYRGERQAEWLVGQLAQSRARWNLLAQGTVMTYLDEQPGPGERFWTDGWNGYSAVTVTQHVSLTSASRLACKLHSSRFSRPVCFVGARSCSRPQPVIATMLGRTGPLCARIRRQTS
jgi:alkaline phosphatase D